MDTPFHYLTAWLVLLLERAYENLYFGLVGAMLGLLYYFVVKYMGDMKDEIEETNRTLHRISQTLDDIERAVSKGRINDA